jgi:hypothetical protein
MIPDDPGVLAEEAMSAFRERDAWGRILPSPAWMDLAPEGREALFGAQTMARRLEAAIDGDGMSTTVKVVTRRARGIGQETRG